MDMNVIQIALGAVAGAVVTLFFVLIIGFIRNQARKKLNKEKELTTKAIGLLMSETNGLFTSYRLGDIAFPEFERKIRELVNRLNAEVNENMQILDGSYVSILGRYTEDKTESLLAIRETISGHIPAPQNNPVQVQPTPVQNSFVEEPMDSAMDLTVPEPAPVAPAAVSAAADFSDFAASMQETANNSDALFGGGSEQTIVQETPQFAQPQTTPQESFAAAQQPASPQMAPAQPVAPQQQAPMFQSPASDGGMLDVEATQEFNVSDIMNSAQAMEQGQGDNSMVSGDDVANKLDAFFG